MNKQAAHIPGPVIQKKKSFISHCGMPLISHISLPNGRNKHRRDAVRGRPVNFPSSIKWGLGLASTATA